MKIKMSNQILFSLVLVLFFIVLINFIGVNMNTEKFTENDSINSNIIILNRIIESANNKEREEENKYEPLSSFKL